MFFSIPRFFPYPVYYPLSPTYYDVLFDRWNDLVVFPLDPGGALEAVEHGGLPGGRGRPLPLPLADTRPPTQVGRYHLLDINIIHSMLYCSSVPRPMKISFVLKWAYCL